ncbi:trihelix transcription factor GT-4-like isoform X1 [Apium graveolens]|uniref:trihelix transcription factor GT-4-like isoform X1 n=1 Tax=Apium graveolens TaxID=4045 RepID=UPI003D79E4DB
MGALQSLLPLHSAVSSARLTSCIGIYLKVSISLCQADAIAANGVSPWDWRGTPENGGQRSLYEGRLIVVKLGDYTNRIGFDATAHAIKEVIKTAFRLRTKRAFWLEDENNVMLSLDRDMPLRNYVLRLDEDKLIVFLNYNKQDQKIL